MTPDYLEIAKYGTGGLAVLILSFAVYIFKMYHKMASNHINHSTDVMNKLIIVIERGNDIIQDLKQKIN